MDDSKKLLYVLDTSCLLYNASSYKGFGSDDVVVPYVVLEELDKFKTRDGEVGKNARQVARELNELRKKGSLSEGIKVNSVGGTLRVELNFHESVNPSFLVNTNDDRILNVCLGLGKEGREVVLITKDINLAVRADTLGISSEDFESDRLVQSAKDIYTGFRDIVVPDNVLDSFFGGGQIYVEDIVERGVLYPNQYVMLTSEFNKGKTALARVVDEVRALAPVRRNSPVWGVSPRNREQQYAVDALLNKDIPLVTLTGQAGCGKTLLTLACALQMVQDDSTYDRLIVSRPVQPMGKDIGYLPGNVEEKLDPWMGPIKDAINFLTREKSRGHDMYTEMVAMGVLEIEPLTYIRGRSIPNTLFILDEAQDLTKHEIKTIVSRMGENSKLILIGDVEQISNPYLDATSSGLAIVIEKFKKYGLSSHVTLMRGERSPLATLAAEIL